MKIAYFIHKFSSKRWIALLIAVIAAHLAAISWMTGHMGLSGWRQSDQESANTTISVSLNSAPAETPVVPAAAPMPEPAPPAETAEPPAPAEKAEKPAAVPKPAEQPASPSQTPLPSANPASGAKASDLPPPNPAGGGQKTPVRVSPPPSALLSYDIQARRQGQPMFGKSKMNWQTDGSSYTLDGESSLLFITLFNFRSEGVIDADYGVSPILYNEKRFRKSETNTHFHRERNIVSFSASTRTYPRKGGEQDRSSVVWQLASIGRQDGTQFRPGVQFPVTVAGARDADVWNFSVAGLEIVDTAFGKMKGWHVSRQPRANSYEQTVDVWLAPEKEWYPVKLRYTDKNGDYLDMTLSGIEPAAK